MSDQVSCTVDDGLAVVRLERPDKHNALTLDMLRALTRTSASLRREPRLRAVVLTGSGPSFCSGLDIPSVLPERVGLARAFVPQPLRGTNVFQEACWGWRRVPAPVLAAVHGHCYGGGLQLALGADLRWTSPTACWSVMEGRWGLVPDMGGVQALSQLVGIEQAKRLTFEAATIEGPEAVRLGLAGECVDDPYAAALAWAQEVATRSPHSLAEAKRLFEQTWAQGARRTLAAERRAQLRLLLRGAGRRTR
ncbi:MAG: crotonase/enoyl-CoA hydratase family protein [Ornithinimicrobium sp.]|uniref:crotonase/enoyl-CoA hydratase family protein n=1 Tax=Ornithinimicrobium sp. TaxID=1977084 RepID=UPI003D9BE80A